MWIFTSVRPQDENLHEQKLSNYLNCIMKLVIERNFTNKHESYPLCIKESFVKIVVKLLFNYGSNVFFVFQLFLFNEATVPGYQTISGTLPQCVLFCMHM